MKPKLLFIFFTAITWSLYSQNVSRIEIEGKIIAKANEVESVTVFNSSSNKGTFADENGNFKLKVALHDRIQVSALQFKTVTVIIDDEILASKKLTVFLTEQINALDEVLILPSGLTGSLDVDVDSVRLISPIVMDFGDIKEYEFPIDHLTKADNTITRQGQFYNGINFAEILGINRWLNKRRRRPSYEELDAEQERKTYDLSQKYSSEYIQENFKIPSDKIQAFYDYIYKNGFNVKLLNKKNELELMEFLLQKSKSFLKQTDAKN
ncbi:carboxypeptidase-like regulatory domain-containing protein [Corallibacter sp.]|uniref:carboxypeptidase-like regulatory domain-containing protein n=1 Tax=Corallibacter sp. TaxID=2038084 RepID=UPI003AB58BBB